MTPQQRTAIYTLASAIAAVAIAYGYLSDDQAAVWLAAFSAFVGTVTAFWHRPTKG